MNLSFQISEQEPIMHTLEGDHMSILSNNKLAEIINETAELWMKKASNIA